MPYLHVIDNLIFMEGNIFYNKFIKKTNKELESILESKSYSDDAILAASQILKERNVELSSNQIKAVESQIQETKIERKESEFSPLTKRIIAFIIDLMVLSAVSFVIGFSFMGTQMIKDPWELILSFILITTYFSVFNSKIGGSSIGKKAMKIQVLNINEEQIPLIRSIVRYSLLTAPYFIFSLLESFDISIYGFIGGLKFSYYFGLLFFLVTDKNLRRGYHDILLNTFVKANNLTIESFNYPKKYSKIFGAVCLTITLISVAGNFYPVININTSEYQNQIDELETSMSSTTSTYEKIIAGIQKIEDVNAIEGINLNTTNGVKSLEIIVQSKTYKGEALTDKVYNEIKGSLGEFGELKNVTIISNYGFSMTLATFNNSYQKNY